MSNHKEIELVAKEYYQPKALPGYAREWKVERFKNYLYYEVDKVTSKGKLQPRVFIVNADFVLLTDLGGIVKRVIRLVDIEHVVLQEGKETTVLIKPFAHAHEPTLFFKIGPGKRNDITVTEMLHILSFVRRPKVDAWLKLLIPPPGNIKNLHPSVVGNFRKDHSYSPPRQKLTNLVPSPSVKPQAPQSQHGSGPTPLRPNPTPHHLLHAPLLPPRAYTVNLQSPGQPLGMSYSASDDIVFVTDLEPGPCQEAGVPPGVLLKYDTTDIKSGADISAANSKRLAHQGMQATLVLAPFASAQGPSAGHGNAMLGLTSYEHAPVAVSNPADIERQPSVQSDSSIPPLRIPVVQAVSFTKPQPQPLWLKNLDGVRIAGTSPNPAPPPSPACVPREYSPAFSFFQNKPVQFFNEGATYPSHVESPEDCVIIVTDKSMYICTPQGEVSRCVPLECISKLYDCDGMRLGVQLDTNDNDLLLQCDRKQDLISTLQQMVMPQPAVVRQVAPTSLRLKGKDSASQVTYPPEPVKTRTSFTNPAPVPLGLGKGYSTPYMRTTPAPPKDTFTRPVLNKVLPRFEQILEDPEATHTKSPQRFLQELNNSLPDANADPEALMRTMCGDGEVQSILQHTDGPHPSKSADKLISFYQSQLPAEKANALNKLLAKQLLASYIEKSSPTSKRQEEVEDERRTEVSSLGDTLRTNRFSDTEEVRLQPTQKRLFYEPNPKEPQRKGRAAVRDNGYSSSDGSFKNSEKASPKLRRRAKEEEARKKKEREREHEAAMDHIRKETEQAAREREREEKRDRERARDARLSEEKARVERERARERDRKEDELRREREREESKREQNEWEREEDRRKQKREQEEEEHRMKRQRAREKEEEERVKADRKRMEQLRKEEEDIRISRRMEEDRRREDEEEARRRQDKEESERRHQWEEQERQHRLQQDDAERKRRQEEDEWQKRREEEERKRQQIEEEWNRKRDEEDHKRRKQQEDWKREIEEDRKQKQRLREEEEEERKKKQRAQRELEEEESRRRKQFQQEKEDLDRKKQLLQQQIQEEEGGFKQRLQRLKEEEEVLRTKRKEQEQADESQRKEEQRKLQQKLEEEEARWTEEKKRREEEFEKQLQKKKAETVGSYAKYVQNLNKRRKQQNRHKQAGQLEELREREIQLCYREALAAERDRDYVIKGPMYNHVREEKSPVAYGNGFSTEGLTDDFDFERLLEQSLDTVLVQYPRMLFQEEKKRLSIPTGFNENYFSCATQRQMEITKAWVVRDRDGWLKERLLRCYRAGSFTQRVDIEGINAPPKKKPAVPVESISGTGKQAEAAIADVVAALGTDLRAPLSEYLSINNFRNQKKVTPYSSIASASSEGLVPKRNCTPCSSVTF